MFAYRSVPHNSTKFSPFYILYQREPVLPVDRKYFQMAEQFNSKDFDGDIDEIKFDETLSSMVLMRGMLNYVLLC